MLKIKRDVVLPPTNIRGVFVEKCTRKNQTTRGVFDILPHMKSGDAVIFKCSTLERARIVQHRVSAMATAYCNVKNLSYRKNFTTRTLKNGVALFRIEQ